MEQMEVLEITNSSAISKISFNDETSEVGIAYTSSPDTFYIFECDEVSSVKKQIESAESVGRFVSELIKNGKLVTI